MAGTTTAMCSSFKQEVLEAGHCFFAIQSGVSVTCSSTVNMTAIGSTAALAVGMAVTGTNAGAGGKISAIVNNTAVTLSVASTGALTSATFTADIFDLALFIVGPSGTFGAATTNYSAAGSDELPTATGYTRPGLQLVNANPNLTNPVTAAAASFTSPSWTSATFSTTGGLIYNTTARVGGSASTGRAVSVHDFGGTQTVTSGTFTLTMPTQDGTTGIIRIT